MKNLVLISFILSLSITGISQESNSAKIKKAEKYFEAYSYSEAIDKFSAAHDGSIETLRMLGESFYKTGNIGKAEVIYKQILDRGESNENDVYRYASTLMQNSKYPEALKIMEKFNVMNPKDSRGKLYVSAPHFVDQLLKDKDQFEIRNLEINSAQEDFSPVYYQDKIVFASSREGTKSIMRRWNWNQLPFLDMYAAVADENGELSHPDQLNKKLNKKFHEGPTSFFKDETMMAFTRNNYKGKNEEGVRLLQIFFSEKENDKWQKAKPFSLNSNAYSVGHPTISYDGKWMYFASNMPGGFGGVDLYKISMEEDGSFGEAINLGDKINTEGNEMFPSISNKDMLIYSSDGKPGLGGLDLFVVQLNEDNSIGKIVNLGVPLNSSRDDFAMVLDKDLKKGYFSSNRIGGKGDDDIYYFDLLKPISFGKTIEGIAKDKKGNILASTSVELLDENNEIIESVLTDESGEYSFSVDADKKFKLNGQKEKYFDGENVADTHTEDEVIIANLILEKDPGLSLYTLITDKETTQPIEGVKLTLIDNMTGEKMDVTTPETGDFRKPLIGKKLNDRGSYNLIIEKEGYFGKTVTYNTLFDHPGVYNIHETLDLSLDKLSVGGDISELIEINPIYFDFNKSNIRPDAAVELDKIVEVMTDYPGIEIELGSHTDARGSNAYNLKLSDRRAKASAKYIRSKIENPNRIIGKGYGETKLINTCKKCTDEQHQTNRRTEFIITKMDTSIKVKSNGPNSFDK